MKFYNFKCKFYNGEIWGRRKNRGYKGECLKGAGFLQKEMGDFKKLKWAT